MKYNAENVPTNSACLKDSCVENIEYWRQVVPGILQVIIYHMPRCCESNIYRKNVES